MPPSNQEMLLTIAHLVNNPLTSIRNALYLASRLTDNQELLDYLDLANGEITRISSSLAQMSSETGALKIFKAAA